MRIDKIEIKNFRCFEHLELDLHPRLNVFVGVNGSGKTALLEALKFGVIGALGQLKSAVPQQTVLSGYKLDPAKDVRTTIFERGEWLQQDQCVVSFAGQLGGSSCRWERGLDKVNVKYSHVDLLKQVKPYFNLLNKELQENADIELPLFAYHSTGRLFLESKNIGQEMNGQRINGYLNAHTAKSSQFLFKTWFEKQERGQVRYRKAGISFDFSAFERVKEILAEFIPGCTSITYDDLKYKEIVFAFENGQAVPYSLLSDGLRNLVAMVSDLALRCAVLNPWMGARINEVAGVVLIDEVDLHLHPSWQRQVVPSLLAAFPKVQFFATTHSPMTLASLEPHIADPEPNIFLLSDQKAEPLPRELFGSANQWLTEVFGLAEPRSIEAETAILEAKSLLAEKYPNTEEVRRISENLMKYIQAHDTFWVRWNYFAEQHGVEL